jgi:hypothetical protein
LVPRAYFGEIRQEEALEGIPPSFRMTLARTPLVDRFGRQGPPDGDLLHTAVVDGEVGVVAPP